MQQLVIVTGLSGAGKTVVLRSMEDMEFYCVDNLPIEMLPPFVSHIMSDKEFYPKISIGIDIRSSRDSLLRFPKILKGLKEKNINIKVMYINASEQVLLNRFSETRRRHPLSTKTHKYSITEAIKLEAELVLPIKAAADLVLDTSNMTVHQLKQHLWKLMSEPSDNVSIILKSFAFKRCVPFDADFVFDARCLINPYWQKELRSFNGKDKEIVSFFNQ
ncbi:MAG: RNase adapter RapZ, partial [Proteobacteria bacterium]|nr:RNase adapter RapZ [Pseudomonadota bacterium]